LGANHGVGHYADLWVHVNGFDLIDSELSLFIPVFHCGERRFCRLAETIRMSALIDIKENPTQIMCLMTICFFLIYFQRDELLLGQPVHRRSSSNVHMHADGRRSVRHRSVAVWRDDVQTNVVFTR